jgi:hypothetical protein
MDPLQVNSRALHDDTIDNGPVCALPTTGTPGTVPANDQEQGADLEKRQTTASTASYAETYPEGGLKAWLVVLGSWSTMISSLGLMNTIAIFHSYTQTHQLSAYNEGTIGWVFSIYTFLAFACGVYIGPIFDKYGPRWLLVAGLACTVGGVVGMSFSNG